MKKNTTIALSLHHRLQIGPQSLALDEVFALLAALKKEKNLRTAAGKLGYSYRKAWNLLNNLERDLGQSLVLKERGRGSRLNEFGEKFLEILQDSQQSLNSALNTQAQIASQRLQTELNSSPILKIVASDHAGLCALRSTMGVSVEIAGSMNALKAFAHADCNMAGFHVPIGSLGVELLALYEAYLNHENYRFILLDSREQGLLSSTEHPVASLEQIAAEKLRFVNRQKDSGTRDLLDLLLRRAGLEAEDLNGYQHEEHTHLAVASLITAREADAGLGVRSVAERLHLHFQPLVAEYYFLLVSQSQLEQTQMRLSLEKLGSASGWEVLDYLRLKQIIENQTSEVLETSEVSI